MIQKVFSVYDSKAEAFLLPIYAATTAVAIRMFGAACNDPKTDFARYAGDYTLFEVGTWDTTTGDHEKLEAKINLGLAITFVESIPEPLGIHAVQEK